MTELLLYNFCRRETTGREDDGMSLVSHLSAAALLNDNRRTRGGLLFELLFELLLALSLLKVLKVVRSFVRSLG